MQPDAEQQYARYLAPRVDSQHRIPLYLEDDVGALAEAVPEVHHDAQVNRLWLAHLATPMHLRDNEWYKPDYVRAAVLAAKRGRVVTDLDGRQVRIVWAGLTLPIDQFSVAPGEENPKPIDPKLTPVHVFVCVPADADATVLPLAAGTRLDYFSFYFELEPKGGPDCRYVPVHPKLLEHLARKEARVRNGTVPPDNLRSVGGIQLPVMPPALFARRGEFATDVAPSKVRTPHPPPISLLVV